MSLVCTLMHPFIGAVNILSVLPIKRKKSNIKRRETYQVMERPMEPPNRINHICKFMMEKTNMLDRHLHFRILDGFIHLYSSKFFVQ